MIEIDGSKGEAGGQIVRTALALSVLLGKAFTLKNIRHGRPVPGLKAQHLHCIKALQQLCVCDVDGAELGSEKITFIPGKFVPKNITIDIGTAGSLTLLLQSLFLPCMFAKKPITLILKGGTDVKWAIPIDYCKEVIVPQLRRYCDITIKVLKRGYFPKGQGEVEISFKPKYTFDKLNNISSFSLMNQGDLMQIKGVSHASSNLQRDTVAERQASSSKVKLKARAVPLVIDVSYSDTASEGSGITLWAIYSLADEIDVKNPIRLGADALGEKQTSPEEIGEKAATMLLKEMQSNAPIDRHLADNLIPLLGLIGGQIRVSEITEHTKTNITVVEAFLGKVFEIDEEKKVIRCGRV